MSYITLLNNIKDLTNNPNTTLEDVLNVDYVSFFYNQGVPSLIQFLISKSEELLQMSIDSQDTALRTKSYDIVCGDNSDILQSMISRNVISKVTEKYMFDDNTSQVILNRIINIFERCFSVDFNKSSSQLYFITEFVRFLHYQSVIGFFIDCVDQPIFGKKFSEWLNEIEFDEKLIDIVQNELKKSQNDPEFLNGMYTLIDKFIQNEGVRQRFLTPSKLPLIIQPCRMEAPVFVKISHAKMILDLCNEFSIQFVSDLMSYLTNLIFDDNVNLNLQNDQNKIEIEEKLNSVDQIEELFLLSYQILIKICTNNNDKNNYFSFSILLDVAFHILNNFQQHSFALIVASDFIIQCSQIDSPIKSDAINRFLSFAKLNLETNQNLNIIAFIYKIMTEFETKVDWTGLGKNEFSSLFEKFIIPKKMIIDAEYGGKAPPLPEITI